MRVLYTILCMNQINNNNVDEKQCIIRSEIWRKSDTCQGYVIAPLEQLLLLIRILQINFLPFFHLKIDNIGMGLRVMIGTTRRNLRSDI